MATIGATFAKFDLDFGANGSVDATRTVSLTAGAGKQYNLARFGGPSDVSSPGGGGNFDNVSISTVEVSEPLSLGLASLGLVGLLIRCRRAEVLP